ncbi:MAG: J domain-containing protein [Treponema sp.]|nr:J domain-containing protein [Treponema sp.]
MIQKKPFWFAPLLGGSIGFIGGITGAIVGVIMGLLLQRLTAQIDDDKSLLAYFENPGPARFREPEPGLAAFCALGIIILYESSHSAKEYHIQDFDALPFRDPIVRSAIVHFRIDADDIPTVESYCRLAVSRFMLLNSDLLAESLAARMGKKGNLDKIGAALELMAFGEGLTEARYIRSMIDPTYQVPKSAAVSPNINPWLILGLEPTASIQEIKSTYRKLATQFHPDQLQFLDKQRQTDAEKAFMKIKEAYREALHERDGKTAS